MLFYVLGAYCIYVSVRFQEGAGDSTMFYITLNIEDVNEESAKAEDKGDKGASESKEKSQVVLRSNFKYHWSGHKGVRRIPGLGGWYLHYEKYMCLPTIPSLPSIFLFS